MATAGGPAPFFFKLIGFCDDASPLTQCMLGTAGAPCDPDWDV